MLLKMVLCIVSININLLLISTFLCACNIYYNTCQICFWKGRRAVKVSFENKYGAVALQTVFFQVTCKCFPSSGLHSLWRELGFDLLTSLSAPMLLKCEKMDLLLSQMPQLMSITYACLTFSCAQEVSCSSKNWWPGFCAVCFKARINGRVDLLTHGMK